MDRTSQLQTKRSSGLTVAEIISSDTLAAAHPAVDRADALRRQLFAGDLLAGGLTGACVALVAGAPSARVGVVALTVTVLWPLIAFVAGLYAVDDLRSWATGIGQTTRVALCSLLLSWPVFALLAGLIHAPHPAAGAAFGALMAGLSTSVARAASRTALHRSRSLRQRTVIVGSGFVASQIVRRLSSHDELGLEPIGFLDEDDISEVQLGIPRLGTVESLAKLVAAGRIDRVIVAFTRGGHEQLLECLRICREAGLPVDVVPRLFEFLDGARSMDQIAGLPLLSITVPSFSRPARVAKRTLDLTLSGIAMVALMPLLGLIAVLIKLDSKGGVLFRQPRQGRDGSIFTLYKFRSMYAGTGVAVGPDGAIIKERDDARVTRVGRALRRLSLDEAPQLLNVLKGDMSLVGPRPLVLPEAATLTEGWHDRRADLRPGLTGPWQVAGRSHISFPEMIQLDYQYVTGWSLARDVELLIATLPAVLSGRGAY
jgi:exopolysaccharide biosynthesis polyprenyl glycosylphosphotransferase